MRNGVPISEHGLISPVESGIQYSQFYEMYDSAIAAGATLEELYKLERGEYPGWFLARLMVWHRSAKMIASHGEDAVARKMKSKGRG